MPTDHNPERRTAFADISRKPDRSFTILTCLLALFFAVMISGFSISITLLICILERLP